MKVLVLCLCLLAYLSCVLGQETGDYRFSRNEPPSFDIKFRSYTGLNFVRPPEYIDGQDLRRLFPLNSETKTVFIIPGDIDNSLEPWTWDMKDELLERDEIDNVIIVDWEGGSKMNWENYFWAVDNAKRVGEVTADLIEAMIESEIEIASDIHIIGHGVGAHAAGFVGKYMQEDGSGKPGRITGLDPAGFRFNDNPPSRRLDENDADFVDVIHTNGGNLGFKVGVTLGTIDFYPNGGQHQPGCETNKCSHNRAHVYFTSSLQGCPYYGNPCDVKSRRVNMGIFAYITYNESEKENKRYCVNTEAEYPYCDFFVQTEDIVPSDLYTRCDCTN